MKQLCYLGSLVTEDCSSCHEVRRQIVLGKEAFSKKSDKPCFPIYMLRASRLKYSRRAASPKVLDTISMQQLDQSV